MNSEQIIIGVGELLNKWCREENCACVLYIENGRICCKKATEEDRRRISDLYVSLWYQEHGFTPSQWDTIATELFNLYNEELACQARQKP